MDRSEIDLSISIVTYNSGDMIYQCLESIFNDEYPFSYEVFVVDNHSQDQPVTNIASKHPEIHLIHNRRNVGYARANNQAIARSRGRYLLILNPDIVVLPGSLAKMYAYMESHPEVGVSGCRLIYPNGSLQASCRRFPTLTTFLLRGLRIADVFPHMRPLENYLLEDEDHRQNLLVDWCLGSCLLVRREAIEDVGMLDEGYFLYYEDIDFCYRMKRKNWQVAYVADAEMIHHYRRLSASIPPNQYTIHHLKSAFYFFWKNRRERKLETIF